MINAANYQENIKTASQQVFALVPGATKYYLYLLIHAIKERNNELTQMFLVEMLELLADLRRFNEMENSRTMLFSLISSHYCKLQYIARTHTLSAAAQIALIQIVSVITAVFSGIIGCCIGGIAGFVRGVWHYEPLSGLGLGVLVGSVLGMTFGFRAPKKLLKDSLSRQIKFGLDGLNETLDNLQQTHLFFKQSNKSFFYYFAEEKEKIRKLFSDDQEFDDFLEKEISYEINSFQASFTGNSRLHGYIGHHAYVLISIKEAKCIIEFSTQPADLSKPLTQREIRTTTGNKLIEMMALHRKLQETDPCTLLRILKQMKPGDRDCFSYIDKVLIGTGQNPITLKRSVDLNPVGKMVGFFIQNLSPFGPDFFTPNTDSLKLGI